MHLVPDERAHMRAIDPHAVCEAIDGAGDPAGVHAWADRFALLADPGRLTLLLCIHGAGEICVSDLALAAGMNATAVSQALRLLRASGLVQSRKDGRMVRYRLADDTAHELLHRINARQGTQIHARAAKQ
jgi:ArsR family transcriptional regulator, lead/cadmium/zinc/bismuth-responsive transcriptional repressor